MEGMGSLLSLAAGYEMLLWLLSLLLMMVVVLIGNNFHCWSTTKGIF